MGSSAPPVTKKRTRQKAQIDFGPLETIEDCQEALRILARACLAGEGNGDDLVKASEVIENYMRFKFFVEEQRLERTFRAH
jgi:hypothetical protein